MFIRQEGEFLVQRFETEEMLPDMTNELYGDLRKKDLKDVLKNIYIVQPRIFKNATKEQSKSVIGFLSLLLNTNERKNIVKIIDSITSLTAEEREDLASVLSKTTLNNIVRTIKMLEQRECVIVQLKKLLFENTDWTNERDHIQKIIECNYWLFAEQYHLISSDKPFEKALSNYLYLLYGEKEDCSIENIEKMRRMDIFLASKRPLDTYANSTIKEENIVLELKAPYVCIDKKIFRQIEDYRDLIKKEPQFNSDTRLWKFYAISNSIDPLVKDIVEEASKNGIPFLASKIGNFEIYIMTWDDIFKCFEHKNKYLYDKLCFDKEEIEKEIEQENKLNGRILSDTLTTNIIKKSNIAI